MIKNILKTIQNDFFCSFKFSFIIIILFLLLKLIASYIYYFSYELNIFNLSNIFGGYIESLFTSNEFKSCNLDNHYTIYFDENISCAYSMRMPVIPYLYLIFTLFSKKYFVIAILKNILLSFIFLILFKIFYKKIKLIDKNIFYIFNFFLLFVFISPVVIKHSSNISYEEGIILELIILWSLFFLLSCYYISRNTTKKNELTPILVISLSTVIYFTKSSTFLCLLISIIISLIWLKKENNLKVILTILISLSLVMVWGYRNLNVSNSFNIGSSINWVNGYHGLNDTALQIYPEIALDQIFFAESFELKNKKIILNNDNIVIKFENEWDKNDYYKNKSLNWIKESPVDFIKLTYKKFYNFFIYLKKTPYSVGPKVNKEYKEYSFQELVVFTWLIFGRLSTILLLFFIYKNWRNEKFMCTFIILMCGAYSLPYLIGFNYERHITPFIIMTIFSNIMLYNANKNRPLLK